MKGLYTRAEVTRTLPGNALPLQVWDLADALHVHVHGKQAGEPDKPQAATQPKSGAKAKSGLKAAAADSAAGTPPGTVVQMRVMAATAAHDKDINAVAIAPNDQFAATGVLV
jgi:U3 small nucleolar RNA-associated protein 13